MHFGHADLLARHLEQFHPRLLGPPNVLGIEATLAAWRESDAWLQAVVTQLDENRRFLRDFLEAQIPEIGYHVPESSFLAWLDCTALNLPESPFDFFLEKARVALSDGREFSSYTDTFVRLNFATPPSILSEMLERMAGAVRSR